MFASNWSTKTDYQGSHGDAWMIHQNDNYGKDEDK